MGCGAGGKDASLADAPSNADDACSFVGLIRAGRVVETDSAGRRDPDCAAQFDSILVRRDGFSSVVVVFQGGVSREASLGEDEGEVVLISVGDVSGDGVRDLLIASVSESALSPYVFVVDDNTLINVPLLPPNAASSVSVVLEPGLEESCLNAAMPEMLRRDSKPVRVVATLPTAPSVTCGPIDRMAFVYRAGQLVPDSAATQRSPH